MMNQQKYAIGIDFGTESGRVVLVSVNSGEEIATDVTPYRHGVLEKRLPTGETLGTDWSLQHPMDYLEVVQHSVRAVLEKSAICADHIIGLGIDFTSCTMLPVDEYLQPLMMNPLLGNNPHSWVKLWKHHAAYEEARELNRIAIERKEKFLPRYGGSVSPEWMVPKIWQVLKEAPEIYERADRFMEAADWVVMQLTGKDVRSSCTVGYKSLWHDEEGYPDQEFFASLDPRLSNIVETKLRGEIIPMGGCAGGLTSEMAQATGLSEGLPVAVGMIDAHVSMPAMGVTEPGKMVMVMGTSICHLLVDDQERQLPGICGVVRDGIIPGSYGYEAGQPAGGDLINWFINHLLPKEVVQKAEEENKTIYQWLEAKSKKISPGKTGLLALDWWNGNRSPLNDTDLTGMIIGMTLQTKPEEIYRALLEAIAFGTRRIMDTFGNGGLFVNELYACGGLSIHSPLLMQIVADVTNKPVKISSTRHTSALGAAMFGALAAGPEQSGYHSIAQAAQQMSQGYATVIHPIPKHVTIYEELYAEYTRLFQYFGQEENNVMKRLRKLKSD